MITPYLHSRSPLRPCACQCFLASTADNQSPHVLFFSASMQHKHSPSFPLFSLPCPALVSGAFNKCTDSDLWVLFWCSCCADGSRQCQPSVHRIVRAQSQTGAFQSKGWVLFSKPPKSFKMIITGTGRNETLKRWVPLFGKLVFEQNSLSAV